MYGRSRADPEWQESKIAVRRTPAERLCTLRYPSACTISICTFHVHDAVHLVVYDMAGLSKVNRIDDLIVAIIFISVQVFSLATVSCIG